MPTQVACPSCNQQLRVPDDLMGRDVKCPKCGTMFVGGAPESAAPTVSRNSSLAGSEGIREERESRYAPGRDDDLDRPSRRGPDLDDDLDDDDDDFQPRHRRRSFAPHRGGTILTFGIISMAGMLCGPLAILGIPALVMGLTDLRAMREERMDPDGRGMTIAGLVMGAISTALLVVGIIILIVAIAAGN